jgi:predicted secreted protein
MPEITPDDLIDAHATSIRDTVLRDVAAGFDVRERVVLALDSRDPLGRDLAGHLEQCGGQAFLDAHATTVARLEEEAATVPVMLFAPVDREAVVEALKMVGQLDAVRALATADGGAVVMVALGCVTVRGVSVYPSGEAKAA